MGEQQRAPRERASRFTGPAENVRPPRADVTMVVMLRRTINTTILAGAAAVLLAACGDDGGTDTPAGASGDGTPACSALVGTPTADVIAAAQCTDENGQLVLLGFASYDCPDGRRLSWNDEGWGYSDGTWQAHARPDGQLIPPDPDLAACSG